jgi:hypothetical protein
VDREQKIDAIVGAFEEALRNSYCDDNSLQGWHVEFWIDKETLEPHVSGELNQNSWNEYKDENMVHIHNIEFVNKYDCITDAEDYTEDDYNDAIEQAIQDARIYDFVEAALTWMDKKPNEDDYKDSNEYGESKYEWNMNKPMFYNFC